MHIQQMIIQGINIHAQIIFMKLKMNLWIMYNTEILLMKMYKKKEKVLMTNEKEMV